MLERLIFVGIMAVLSVIVYQGYTRRQLAKLSGRAAIDPILKGIDGHLPTIVYFTTPNCIPCITQQQPALQKLRASTEIQVVQIDATEQPDAAQRWGVMTAPTTFILDGNLRPQAVNYGVADERKLLKQVNEAMQVA